MQQVTREFRVPAGMRPRYQGTAHELIGQSEPVIAPAGTAHVQTLRTAVDPTAEAAVRAAWDKATGHAPQTPEEHADIARRLRNGRGMGLYRVGVRMQRKDGGIVDRLVSEHDTPEEAQAAAAAEHARLSSQVAGAKS